MSSRLIAPNEGVSVFTMSTNLSLSYSAIQRSTASMLANFLKRTAFPSITGLDASAPKLPSPKTAVPLEMTARLLCLLVYFYASRGYLLISIQGQAT